jgi:hypothetical protein
MCIIFGIPRCFNWFTGCVADDQAEKQLFGAYLHVLKSRVDDVWWEKNRGRTWKNLKTFFISVFHTESLNILL